MDRSLLFRINKKPWFWLTILTILGGSLRLLNFPIIPPGLNQDEAANAYESYSLLVSGGDRWGNLWPIYFVGWGSGASVLLALVQIPFIKFLGLSVLAIRLPSLIFGILLIPLNYFVTRTIFNPKTALISTLFVAILPWPFMLSRWALEANLLVFISLLGLFTMVKSLELSKFKTLKISQKILILCSFPVLYLSLYAYALILLPLFLFTLFFVYYYRFYLKIHFKYWLVSSFLGLLVALPLILFTLKNYLGLPFYFLENLFPFSFPDLAATRLAQVSNAFWLTPFLNLYFFLSGFQDTIVWNNDPAFLPLSLAVFPFSLVGFLNIFQKETSEKLSKILILWLISFSPILVLIPLNTTRANALLIPLLILSSHGILVINQEFSKVKKPNYLLKIVVVWISLYALAFQVNYHFLYPQKVSEDFNSGLKDTLVEARNLSKSSEKIYLTKEILINYIYPLVYFEVNPVDFRKEANYRIEKGDYSVEKWRNFYFDKDYLAIENGETWLAILKPCQNQWCDQYSTLNQDSCRQYQELYQKEAFRIYRCYS